MQLKLLKKRDIAGMSVRKYSLIDDSDKTHSYEVTVTIIDEEKTVDIEPAGDPFLQPGISVSDTYAELTFANVVLPLKEYDEFIRHTNFARSAAAYLQENWNKL